MDDQQMKGMAAFLARRTGVTDPVQIAADARRWTRAAALHTGEVAPTNAQVANAIPSASFLRHTVARHQELLDTGHEAANNGANVADLRTAISERHTQLDEFSPVSFSPERGASNERAAMAQILHSDYSRVERFSDGLPSGNLTYKGKASYRANGRIPDSFRPDAEERDSHPGQGRMRRAAEHFGGMTNDSPFVSVTGHLQSARRTPDPQLQAIMHGEPNRSGAPHIDTFMVPSHGLLRADTVRTTLTQAMGGRGNVELNYGVGIGLAEREHEQLFSHETLDDYRVARGPNPYRNQNRVGIFHPRSSFADNMKKAFNSKKGLF